jgi:hypothetical protein
MTRRKDRPQLGEGIDLNRSSERDISAATGLSRRQIWQARQVASIPADEFEQLLASDAVPTVTKLVAIARRQSRDPARRRARCPRCGGPL